MDHVLGNRLGAGRKRIAALAVAWGVLVAAGLAVASRGEGVAARESALSSWPVASKLHRAPTGPTLLVFVHPQCPCSGATITELERLVAHTAPALSVQVVAFLPDEAWADVSLLRRAAAIPGVQVVADRDGSEAARFDAATSGQSLLFAPDGHVLFRGGITSARGHEGDNAGSRAIEALVAAHPSTSVLRSSVFGCAIASRTEGGR